jgi:hypothetical protein
VRIVQEKQKIMVRRSIVGMAVENTKKPLFSAMKTGALPL